MPVKKLKDFLDMENIRYVSIRHSPVFTAQEIAAATHTPGKELAKIVMVRLDGKISMAVLPASYEVDFEKLREIAGVQKAELAKEEEFKYLFPDCDIGAMPPFGNLYDMDVFVADSLAEDSEIAFNAGSHSELIRLTYQDFERLVKPKVGNFARKTTA
jgi:Ala-tRNA(Pro) deacylase